MHITTFSKTRVALFLDTVGLQLWLYLDPGWPPRAVWFSDDGELLAEVPVWEC